MKYRALVWAAAAAMNLIACGSSGAARDSEPPEFAGTWTFQAGSEAIIACPSAPPIVAPLANTALVLESGGDGALHGTSSVGCRYTYTIDGDRATMTPGQTCDVPDGRGGSTTEHLQHDTLTFHGPDTLTLDGVGTIGPGGACVLTVSGSLAR